MFATPQHEEKEPNFQTVSLNTNTDTHVGVITFTTPKRANAMTLQFFQEFTEAVKYMDRNSDVRCVVITGDVINSRHFSSGLDISVVTHLMSSANEIECSGRRGVKLLKGIQRMQDSFTVIEKSSKPFIAAVHGQCIGGAVDLICCCDMRYCSADATFCVKEVDLAITADLGTIQRLPMIVGAGRARELTFTARSITSSEALEMGIVTRVFADKDALSEEVLKVATQVAAKSPLALAGIKSSFLYSRDRPVTDGLLNVAQWNATTILSSDLPTAVGASVRGEQPIFSRL